MTVRGVVFDFDGLILDTEMPAFRSWQEIYEAHGATLEEADWHAAIGTYRGVDPYRLLVERATGPVAPAAEILERRDERKMELVLAEAVLPGVLDWIDAAIDLGLRLGVASTSSVKWVGGHLERLGLRSHFHVVSCWEAHLKPKPAPDVYLGALDVLGIDGADAIAVEDSPNGVKAAKAAGIAYVVAVPNYLTAPLDFSLADRVVHSLEELPLPTLLAELWGGQ